jgi:peptidoglycan/LPS O-acetylase OafA/YrhL
VIPLSASVFLDALRFFLALAVLISHATQVNFQSGWPSLTRWGFFAVGSFFVLSGFVIRALDRRNDSAGYPLREFGAERASRLLSVSIIALAVTTACDLLSYRLAPDFYLGNWGGSFNHPVMRILLNLTCLSQVWGKDISPFSNTPFWSISYEAAFYALWATLRYVQTYRRSYWLPLIPAAIYGPFIVGKMLFWLLGISLYDSSLRTRVSPTPGTSAGTAARASGDRFATYGAALIVGAGAVAVLLLLSPAARAHQTVGAALAAITDLRHAGPGYIVGLGAVTTYLLLLPVLSLLSALDRHARIPPRIVSAFRFLGELTFPLYLLHYPLLVLARAAGTYDPQSALQKIAMMLVIIAIAALTVRPAATLKRGLRKAFKKALGVSPPDRAVSALRAQAD